MPSFMGSPALQVDVLLSEPLGKPKNTGVGNLCLWILGWVAMLSPMGSYYIALQTPTDLSNIPPRLLHIFIPMPT